MMKKIDWICVAAGIIIFAISAYAESPLGTLGGVIVFAAGAARLLRPFLD